MQQSAFSTIPTHAQPATVDIPDGDGARRLERRCENNLASMKTVASNYVMKALDVPLFRQEGVDNTERESQGGVSNNWAHGVRAERNSPACPLKREALGETFPIQTTRESWAFNRYAASSLETGILRERRRPLSPQHGDNTTSGPIASWNETETINQKLSRLVTVNAPGASLRLDAKNFIEAGVNNAQIISSNPSGVQQLSRPSTSAWLPSSQHTGEDNGTRSLTATECYTFPSTFSHQSCEVPTGLTLKTQTPRDTNSQQGKTINGKFGGEGIHRANSESTVYYRSRWRGDARPLPSEIDKTKTEAYGVHSKNIGENSGGEGAVAYRPEDNSRGPVAEYRNKGKEICPAGKNLFNSGTFAEQFIPGNLRKDVGSANQGSPRSSTAHWVETDPSYVSSCAATLPIFPVADAMRCSDAQNRDLHAASAVSGHCPTTATTLGQQNSQQDRPSKSNEGPESNIRESIPATPCRWTALLQQLTRTSTPTSNSGWEQTTDNPSVTAPCPGAVNNRAGSHPLTSGAKSSTLSLLSSSGAPPLSQFTPAADTPCFVVNERTNIIVDKRLSRNQRPQGMSQLHENHFKNVEELVGDLNRPDATRRYEEKARSRQTSGNTSTGEIVVGYFEESVEHGQSQGGVAHFPPSTVIGCGGTAGRPLCNRVSCRFSPRAYDAAGRETSSHGAPRVSAGSGDRDETCIDVMYRLCQPPNVRTSTAIPSGAHNSSSFHQSSNEKDSSQLTRTARLQHGDHFVICDEEQSDEHPVGSGKSEKDISKYTRMRCYQWLYRENNEPQLLLPPPPPPPPSSPSGYLCGGSNINSISRGTCTPHSCPPYQLSVREKVYGMQFKDSHGAEQQQYPETTLERCPLSQGDMPGLSGWSTNERELDGMLPSIPRAVSGSNSGMLWTADVPPVSLLLTLPLDVPYGKIIKLGSPNVLHHSDANLPAPHPDFIGSRNTVPCPFTRHSSRVMRAPGAKKSYYCFSPHVHPGAHTLLSHAGGICDTFATSLHVELAIFYVPLPLLQTVASLFQALAPRLPRLASPLKISCGGLDERSAPGRFGGKVLTVSCAVSERQERHKFQQMQDFLSVFQSKVDFLVSEYNRQREQVLRSAGQRTVDGQCRRGYGEGWIPGKKANTWKYSMNCVPTSLRIPDRLDVSGTVQRHTMPSVNSARKEVSYAPSGYCIGAEEEVLSGTSNETGAGAVLDLTIRAFESKPLDRRLKEYARRLVVPDVYISEVRLITTHSLEGRTCELDPRFPDYCIGTRPILLDSSGRLCRHTLAESQELSDVWEVHLRSGNNRDMQKRLVYQCVLAAAENRPLPERYASLKSATDAGITLWMNGKLVLTPLPPFTQRCRENPNQQEKRSPAFFKSVKPFQKEESTNSSSVSYGRRLDFTGGRKTTPSWSRRETYHPLFSLSGLRKPLTPQFPGGSIPGEVLRCESTGTCPQKAEHRPFCVPLNYGTDREKCSSLAATALAACTSDLGSNGDNFVGLIESQVPSFPHECKLSDTTCVAPRTVGGPNDGEFAYSKTRRQHSHHHVDELDSRLGGLGSTEGSGRCLTCPHPGLHILYRKEAVTAPAFQSTHLLDQETHLLRHTDTEVLGKQRNHTEEILELLKTMASYWSQGSCHRTAETKEACTQQQGIGSEEAVGRSIRSQSRITERSNAPPDTEGFFKQLLALGVPFVCSRELPEPLGKEDGVRRSDGSSKAPLLSSRSSIATCEGSDNSPAAVTVRNSFPSARYGVMNLARLLDHSRSSLMNDVTVLPGTVAGNRRAASKGAVDRNRASGPL